MTAFDGYGADAKAIAQRSQALTESAGEAKLRTAQYLLLGRARPGMRVWCLNRPCRHYRVVHFEAIGAPAGFTFIDLPKTRRFVCRECGTRDVQVMPDWPPHRTQRKRQPDVDLTRPLSDRRGSRRRVAAIFLFQCKT
ncbi:hypothetical protein [Methylocystis suflitae]|uniref:hypothetical protein n=1 Tax=Methylocystis suflitae TaxID=2951405 RepID=UPI00210E9398|nr:hypothetical protein [Methylocystis suflitae]MCQ4188031.1 hypothetical protein [Methylocystis suflitae]